ncbi:MAG TPA: sugar ABC transporter ATP-binding protein [Solirubrobacteraceae bacterium]|nr:sugar ABC transporter ATP-binding protein [Solirubrobacteraceae bacterium]
MSPQAAVIADNPHLGVSPAALRVEGLSKTFPGTRGLIDAAIEIRPGEVHALVGQNGSGKSTLIKTLAGYHMPDPGALAEIAGEPFALGETVPEDLRFVHQDLGLVLELSAMDNLALRGGFIRGRAGRIRWREQERETYRILDRFDVELDIHRPLAEATPVQRTVVAIAGALQGWHGGRGVLVLDEPTAVLPHDEVERLLAMVREVRRSGTSVLYVSHRLDEIFEIADRVTVLRAGRVVRTLPVADVDHRSLAQLMVGTDVDPDYRAPVADRPDSPVVLELRDVHGRRLHGLSLQVHRGEILGVAGLPGDGVQELPYALAGHARHPVRGEIRLPQRSSAWSELADARQLGIPLVPADRAHEAIVSEFTVRENLTLSVLDRIGSRGRLDAAAEQGLVARWTERLAVVAASAEVPVSTLSGGNQQKVVLARCLARDPELLVLAEPTAGVDVGTRVAIYELIAGLARDGLTVIVSSSDLGDLLAMCTRIVVLRDGRVGAELGAEGLTEHELVNAIEGERSAHGANNATQ